MLVFEFTMCLLVVWASFQYSRGGLDDIQINSKSPLLDALIRGSVAFYLVYVISPSSPRMESSRILQFFRSSGCNFCHMGHLPCRLLSLPLAPFSALLFVVIVGVDASSNRISTRHRCYCWMSPHLAYPTCSISTGSQTLEIR